MMNIVSTIIRMDNIDNDKGELAEEQVKNMAEDELDQIMLSNILNDENPDIFAQMNILNVGVNMQENQKVDINVISDNLKMSADKYGNMKSDSVLDDFPENKCPYSSIDIVFNKRNIWFNRQHYNPAVIK